MKYRDRRRLMVAAVYILCVAALIAAALHGLYGPGAQKRGIRKRRHDEEATRVPNTPFPRIWARTELARRPRPPALPGQPLLVCIVDRSPENVPKALESAEYALLVLPGEASGGFEAVLAARPGIGVLLIHGTQRPTVKMIHEAVAEHFASVLPRTVVFLHQDVAGDVEAFAREAEGALERGEHASATCLLVSPGGTIVSHGVDTRIVTSDEVALAPSLRGFPETDGRVALRAQKSLPDPHCAAFAAGALSRLPADDRRCRASWWSCFSASVWDAHVQVSLADDGDRPAFASPARLALARPADDLYDANAVDHICDRYNEVFLRRIYQSRESYLPGVSLLGTTVMWDTFCSCTGVNIEAISYLVGLEKGVQTRAVASDDCWCKGYPKEVQTTLSRLVKPKHFDPILKSLVPESEQLTVWVSHKPVDFYPTFPYRGAVDWEQRPDYVIGRSMTEVDAITKSWVTTLNEGRPARGRGGVGRRAEKADPPLVDEVWVPSTFVAKAFRDSGVTIPVTVIPECVDVYHYDPRVARTAYPGLPPAEYTFLSNFKWEPRKGWDILLAAFFTAFPLESPVRPLLVLKTHLYMDKDPHNPGKIRDKIRAFARERGYPPALCENVHVIAEEVPERDMPRVYKAADCFVLPTRGEGWGLGMHQAMSMGLPTIATNWSGNVDFMTEDTSLLIKVAKIEQSKDNSAGNWAVPDVRDLVEKMQWVVAHRAEAAQLGEAARKHIVKNFSEDAVIPILLKRLKQIKDALRPQAVP
ncbi:glycosyl transferase [Diplonema papillatum]|nr:glycosyl transferase [Diplonema papillatum]|eukprot:gene16501-25300_t